MAGLLSVRTVGVRGGRSHRDDPVALPDSPGRRSGPAGRAPHVLLSCGRAPGRALWPGRRGSTSMGAAWVGPLHWTQWAGGHCRLIPRRRRTGPGGEPRLPDCAFGGPPERTGAGTGAAGGRRGAGQATSWQSGMKWNIVRAGESVPTLAVLSENGRMASVRGGWAGRFADTRRVTGPRSAGSSGGGRISAGTTRGDGEGKKRSL